MKYDYVVTDAVQHSSVSQHIFYLIPTSPRQFSSYSELLRFHLYKSDPITSLDTFRISYCRKDGLHFPQEYTTHILSKEKN